MPNAAAVISRINSLITDGIPISTAGKKGYGLNDLETEKGEGWLVAAANVVALVVRDPTSPYRTRTVQLIKGEPGEHRHNNRLTDKIGAMVGMLRELLADIEAGLLTDYSDQVRAEVFDNILDHADAYHRAGHKFAGVIAGVVFEDTIRRLGQKQSLATSKIDELISELVKCRILTDLKAKRARAAADVRTKATHARWDEFDLNDVGSCISFTRELIDGNLA